MKRIVRVLIFSIFALLLISACGITAKSTKGGAVDGGYGGTQVCLGCHNGSAASDKREFLKS